jgi:hypothetical protein
VMAAIRRCRSPEGPWVLGASLRKQVYTTYPQPVWIVEVAVELR